MQALIDFDGWRKWKDFSQQTQASSSVGKVVGSLGHKGSSTSTAAHKGGPGGAIASGKLAMAAGGTRRDKRLSSNPAGTGTIGAGGGSEVVERDRDGGRGSAIIAGG